MPRVEMIRKVIHNLNLTQLQNFKARWKFVRSGGARKCKSKFDWDNIDILDKEKSYKKDLCRGFVHILGQKRTLNLREATERLSTDYPLIIERQLT